MTPYVALLRAINVGGTGKLPMTELRALCEGCGFTDVATYIQSGNVVFRSALETAAVKKTLEAALAKKMGKPFGVILRSGAELAQVAARSPFPRALPNQLLVMFLDEAPAKDSLDAVVVPGGDELELRGRELYVHFPMGAGQSKLRLPFAKTGTARNLNTVRKLAEMAAEMEASPAKAAPAKPAAKASKPAVKASKPAVKASKPPAKPSRPTAKKKPL